MLKCLNDTQYKRSKFLKIQLEMEWVNPLHSYCSSKPLWLGIGASSAGSYITDPISPPIVP